MVSVDLLPPEVHERTKRRRENGLIAAIAVVLVAALVLNFLATAGRVQDAQDQLAVEQQELAVLSAEEATLAEFGALELERITVDTAIATSLGDELSFGGILQDLAAVLPAGTNLRQLTIAEADSGTVLMTLRGEVKGQLAPDVERILLSLQKAATIVSPSLIATASDDEGFTSFELRGAIGPAAYTGRYVGGLPEVLR